MGGVCILIHSSVVCMYPHSLFCCLYVSFTLLLFVCIIHSSVVCMYPHSLFCCLYVSSFTLLLFVCIIHSSVVCMYHPLFCCLYVSSTLLLFVCILHSSVVAISLVSAGGREEMGEVLLPWLQGSVTGRRSISRPLATTTGRERPRESTNGECTECCHSNCDSCHSD